jgi:DNA-binding transcriptional MerR regulator
MRIGELSARSGVSTRSLRYYEKQGLLAARRESNGYREYDDAAVVRARTIQMLFGMDFPRDLVKTVLACAGDVPDSAHEALADQLVGVREELAERIRHLTETHRKVSDFLDERGRTASPSAVGSGGTV